MKQQINIDDIKASVSKLPMSKLGQLYSKNIISYDETLYALVTINNVRYSLRILIMDYGIDLSAELNMSPKEITNLWDVNIALHMSPRVFHTMLRFIYATLMIINHKGRYLKKRSKELSSKLYFQANNFADIYINNNMDDDIRGILLGMKPSYMTNTRREDKQLARYHFIKSINPLLLVDLIEEVNDFLSYFITDYSQTYDGKLTMMKGIWSPSIYDTLRLASPPSKFKMAYTFLEKVNDEVVDKGINDQLNKLLKDMTFLKIIRIHDNKEKGDNDDNK